MPEKKPGHDTFAEAMRRAAPYLNLGWTFALSMAAGVLGGWWLDGKLGTRPWLLLAGAALGIVTAFVSFFRVVLPPRGGGSTGEGGGS